MMTTEGISNDAAVIKELTVMTNERKTTERELDKAQEGFARDIMLGGLGQQMKEHLAVGAQPQELVLPQVNEGWWKKFKGRLKKTFNL